MLKNINGEIMSYIYLSLRAIAIFIIMLIAIRILGKKEVGQLSIFDLIVLLVISDTAAMGIPDNKLFLGSIICVIILVIMQKLIGLLLKKNKFLRKYFDGNPTVIIYDGKVLYDNMKHENYTIDDLICQVRINGLMDISEVNLAILETTGELSVFSKARYDKVFLPVIESGEKNVSNLELLMLDDKKLELMVFDKGYNIKDVFYASSDGFELFIIEKR